jgi:hypothetical protein
MALFRFCAMAMALAFVAILAATLENCLVRLESLL